VVAVLTLLMAAALIYGDLTSRAWRLLVWVSGAGILASALLLSLRWWRRPRKHLLQRSFDTSILAFPPEKHLGPRDQRQRR
jgi:hypothetical protein